VLLVVREDYEPALIGGWLHFALAKGLISYKEALYRFKEVLQNGANPDPFTSEFYSEYVNLFIKLYNTLRDYSREFHNFTKKHVKVLKIVEKDCFYLKVLKCFFSQMFDIC
jgi:gluconokinase